MQSWRVHNPSFDTWFWTDSAVRRLLELYFPASLVELYDSYPLAINRADVRKYIILFTVGGLVADLDVQCLRPVRPLLHWLQLSRHSCVLSQEPALHREFLYSAGGSEAYVSTAIIACRPQHPFMRFVLNLLPRYAANAEKLRWNENVLNSTGPTFLTDALRLYNATHRHRQTGDCSQSAAAAAAADDDDGQDLLVAPSRWFLPTYDPLHTAHFQTLCLLTGTRSRSKRRRAGCENVLHNVAYNDSYTTHHWLHSWADGFVHAPVDNVTRLTRITRLIS